MSDFRIDKITNRDGTSVTQIAGISTFSGTSGMQLPSGPTEYRGGRGRGLICGGYNYPSGQLNLIQKIEISTTGDATDFGDMVSDRYSGGGGGSSVRGIYCGGRKEANPAPDFLAYTQYIIFSSEGGASYFGDLSNVGTGLRATSNNIRGLSFGAVGAATGTIENIIEYFTIATTGSASPFGDLTQRRYGGGTLSSPTRGIYAGGVTNVSYGSPSYSKVKTIDYTTFETRGNAVHFGELAVGIRANSGASSTTRGVFAGGYTPTNVDTIEYITIATEGNAIDFGDLAMDTSGGTSVSNSVRGVFGDGNNSPSHTDAMNYVTISTTGNAVDFGDMLTKVLFSSQNVADSHGGIG